MSLVGFSNEQEELARTVRGFLAERSPMTEVRRLMDSPEGYDAGVWRQMAQELGLQGIAVPEEHGGAGYGYVELTAVFEELGRSLLPSPFFATVGLAQSALLVAGDEGALGDYLPGIAAGDTVATLAWVEDDGSWTGGTATTARESGGGWKLDGHKTFVLDGGTAQLILVLAGTPAGPALFAVDGSAPGLERRAQPTLDQTRRLARIELHDTPARLIGEAGGGDAILDAALDRAAVLLAAELVGSAQACLDMSVAYAKDREQFGRPIGSFQAIKHKCAEMLIDLEGARSAAYYGGWAASESPAELPVVASVAKATASEAFFHAAAENVQIHGGIGCTWEHDAHLYLKRAKTSSLLLGDPRFHRQRLADRIGL